MKNTATPAQASWADAMRTFDRDLQRRGAAERTRRAYGADIGELATWAAAQGIEPSAVTYRVLRGYAARQSDRGAAPRTLARKLASARAFFRSMVEHGAMAANPADLVPSPKLPQTLPRVMKPADVAELLDRIPATTPLELRDRALFELAYACGLRAEELVNLDHGSIDFDAEQVRVEGKGGKTRFVPAGEHALAAVGDYLERARKAAPGHHAGPRAVPLQVRQAPLHVRRPAPPEGLGAPRRDPGERPSARPQALVRDSSSGGRCRSTGHPGDARPQLHIDDPGLHSGRVRSLACRVSAQPSAGLKGAGSGHQRQSTRAQRPLAEIQGRGV